MIEDLLKDLTAAILTLNETIKQQARPSEPEPEKHEHKTPVAKVKTTAPTEPAAESTPEAASKPDAAPTTTQTVEDRHKALQQLCLKLVRADPSRKARIKSIMGEYGATLVADIPEKHLSEAERRIADIGEGD